VHATLTGPLLKKKKQAMFILRCARVILLTVLTAGKLDVQPSEVNTLVKKRFTPISVFSMPFCF